MNPKTYDHSGITDGRSVKTVELILTTLAKRGSGKYPDPVREVAQLWDKDGRLIAEFDPCDPHYNQSEIVEAIEEEVERLHGEFYEPEAKEGTLKDVYDDGVDALAEALFEALGVD